MSILKLFGSGANQISRNKWFGRLAWCDFLPLIGVGAPAPTIASATTIAPLNAIVFVSGTTAIATITPPPSIVGGGQITLIPTGLWSTNTAGNIALATTVTVNKALILTWDVVTSKWYPSYFDNQYGIGLGGATPSSGVGISFPAAQSASSDVNTLDDYEEGTWTPVISGSTVAGVGTYTTQIGNYTKIGNVVTASLYVVVTAHTGTGNMLLSGLPFASNATAGTYLAAAVAGVQNLGLTAGYILSAYVGPNGNSIALQQIPVGGGTTLAVAMDPTFEFMINVTYRV